MKNNYKLWIVLSLVIVLAAGIMGGILFERHVLDKKTGKSTRRRSTVRFPGFEIMAQELNLTQEQQEQIRDIFKNNEKRIKEMRGHFSERYSSLRTQLKSEIKNVLTEEQNLKFEAMIEKYLSQRKRDLDKRKKHSGKPRKHKKDKGEKR